MFAPSWIARRCCGVPALVEFVRRLLDRHGFDQTVIKPASMPYRT